MRGISYVISILYRLKSFLEISEEKKVFKKSQNIYENWGKVKKRKNLISSETEIVIIEIA